MRGYLLSAILCLSLTAAGCASARKGAMELTDEYVQTVQTEREIMIKLLAVWPYRSCQLRAALGPRIDELPGSVLKAWGDLDEVATVDEPTDCDLGRASGASILMTYEVVMKAIKAIAPDVIGILPALL